MSIWIELHCDNQSPATDPCGRIACVSGRGDQPGDITMTHPSATLNALKARARKRGWVIEKDGRMTCPVCVAYWKAQPPSAGSGGEEE